MMGNTGEEEGGREIKILFRFLLSPSDKGSNGSQPPCHVGLKDPF